MNPAPETALQEALQLFNAGRYGEGRVRIGQALAGAPADSELRRQVLRALANAAITLFQEGRFPLARDFMYAALGSSTQDRQIVESFASLLHCRAIALFNEEHFAAARSLLQEALALTPGDGTLRNSYVTLLQRLGIDAYGRAQWHEARELFREALALAPDRPGLADAYGKSVHRLGIEAYEVKDMETAAGMFGEAAVFLPEEQKVKEHLAAALCHLGVDCFNRGQLDEAERLYRRALVLAPEKQFIPRNLSVTLFHAGKTEEAIAVAQQVRAACPDEADWAGWCCFLMHSLGPGPEVEALAEQFFRDFSPERSLQYAVPRAVASAYCSSLLHRHGPDHALAVFYELSRRYSLVIEFAVALATGLLEKNECRAALQVLQPFVHTNDSGAFSVSSIALFRKTLAAGGQPAISRLPRAAGDGPAIAISSLSYYGRFAHQVLEYLNGYLYAHRYGLALETPDWVGHYLFQLDDPLTTPGKFMRRAGRGHLLSERVAPAAADIVGVDFFSPGFPILTEADRALVQERLRLRPQWLSLLNPLVEALEARGKTIVALHIRRGDRIAMNDVTDCATYLNWLEKVWPTLDQPVLYLASDDIEGVKADFAAYAPVSLRDIAEPWDSNDYVQDFFVLMHSDLLGMSTGAYGYLAALLNRRARHCYRPSPDGREVVEFLPYG